MYHSGRPISTAFGSSGYRTTKTNPPNQPTSQSKQVTKPIENEVKKSKREAKISLPVTLQDPNINLNIQKQNRVQLVLFVFILCATVGDQKQNERKTKYEKYNKLSRNRHAFVSYQFTVHQSDGCNIRTRGKQRRTLCPVRYINKLLPDMYRYHTLAVSTSSCYSTYSGD